jgi:hypothetical protein
LIRGFRLSTQTLHRINILGYIRQPSRIIRASFEGRLPYRDRYRRIAAASCSRSASRRDHYGTCQRNRLYWLFGFSTRYYFPQTKIYPRLYDRWFRRTKKGNLRILKWSSLWPYGSYVKNLGLLSPLKAVFTINGHTVSYGTRPISGVTASVTKEVDLGASPADQMTFNIDEKYSVGDAHGGGSISVGFASGAIPFSKDFRWESNIPYSEIPPCCSTSIDFDYW